MIERKALVRRLPSRLEGGLLLCLMSAASWGQMPVYGDYWAHDPSRMIKDGSNYFIFRTSQGIMGKTSTDLRDWTYSGQVFPGAPPAWTTNTVTSFTGFFWAPDIIYQNGQYYLYYAVSEWGTIDSAIGLVTSPSLVSPTWTDQGMVVRSVPGVSAFNAIDPCVLQDTNGTLWLVFGSYSNGIYITQLDPLTGKPLSGSSYVRISGNGPVYFSSTEEGSFLYRQGGYYYLFVNWGGCCDGIDSTYNIRYGRSTNITGPYLDRNGVSLLNAGGTTLLESTARFIGPGQTGIMNDHGTNWFTYHYYDGNNAGTPTLGLTQITWSSDGWPVLTNDWSAFYTFNTDAREHLALYNGTLENGATITNEPGRGNVLNLDGVSQYVLLPEPVANASTFATWAKWNGGADWQRIFDFGTGTTNYLFLTPQANNGKLRFAITLDSNGAEQTIDAPSAMPTNSWCHVAVTLDGSTATGVLYLDGQPVATNSSLTIRPWQTLACSNYIGKSQWPADPLFGGQISSFRIFGRALSAAEIQAIAWAHPAIAHRYSFDHGAWDSIGMAHGTLMGNAVVTNSLLELTGMSGGYVNLPGGLVSGSSALTIESWATFGTNGNWARLVDFGNINGDLGQDFIFYSPHTSLSGQRLGLSTDSGTVNFDLPGTLDNQTVHVVCIVDPTNQYLAIYTNAVLQSAATNLLPPLTGVSNAWSFIGRSLFNADAWLNASIDELRLYDGRLTPQEISANDQFGPQALALPINLEISSTAAGLTLTWPSYDVGFTVQTSPTLGSGAAWTAISQPATLTNDIWCATVPRATGEAFYRLCR
jgi:hypothetical protein